jgi:hypothetical protein
MTDAEWQRIEAEAAFADLSASEFIRRAALAECDRRRRRRNAKRS